MAACNAAFWDGKHWDGSEEVMIASRQLATRLPTRSYVSIVSGSTISTLVMALQGVQTISIIVAGVSALPAASGGGLTDLFSYLAILGLSRLVSAFWLSSDYAYDVN